MRFTVADIPCRNLSSSSLIFRVVAPGGGLAVTGAAAVACATAALDLHKKGWTLHQLRHSALQHLAVDGRTAPELQAKSRHQQHLASLGRYVQLGEQTSGPRSPPMPTQPLAANLADPMTGGHPHRTVGGGNSARAGPLTPLVVRLLLKLRCQKSQPRSPAVGGGSSPSCCFTIS